VGAVCPNWARTDLCGGREVTRVPTAIARAPVALTTEVAIDPKQTMPFSADI